jgi:hypothetical protein
VLRYLVGFSKIISSSTVEKILSPHGVATVAERSAKRKRSKGGFVEYFWGLPGAQR